MDSYIECKVKNINVSAYVSRYPDVWICIWISRCLDTYLGAQICTGYVSGYMNIRKFRYVSGYVLYLDTYPDSWIFTPDIYPFSEVCVCVLHVLGCSKQTRSFSKNTREGGYPSNQDTRERKQKKYEKQGGGI